MLGKNGSQEQSWKKEDGHEVPIDGGLGSCYVFPLLANNFAVNITAQHFLEVGWSALTREWFFFLVSRLPYCVLCHLPSHVQAFQRLPRVGSTCPAPGYAPPASPALAQTHES